MLTSALLDVTVPARSIRVLAPEMTAAERRLQLVQAGAVMRHLAAPATLAARQSAASGPAKQVHAAPDATGVSSCSPLASCTSAAHRLQTCQARPARRPQRFTCAAPSTAGPPPTRSVSALGLRPLRAGHARCPTASTTSRSATRAGAPTPTSALDPASSRRASQRLALQRCATSSRHRFSAGSTQRITLHHDRHPTSPDRHRDLPCSTRHRSAPPPRCTCAAR